MSEEVDPALVRELLHGLKAPYEILQYLAAHIREIVSEDPDYDYLLRDCEHLEDAGRLAQLLVDAFQRKSLNCKRVIHKVGHFLEKTYGLYVAGTLGGNRECLRLHMDGVASDREIELDEDLLRIVLYNLTDNSRAAWRRTRGNDLSGLRMSWEIAETETHLVMKIRDNGPGLDAQRPVSGPGMGLRICKKYVEELHQGRFSLEGVEAGCVATICLPFPRSPQGEQA
jgi:signal transduction histidine kinase